MNKMVSVKNVHQVVQNVQKEIHAIDVLLVQLQEATVNVLVQQAFISLLILLDSVKDVILIA